jgi:hypothetical protein
MEVFHGVDSAPPVWHLAMADMMASPLGPQGARDC